MDLWYAFEKEEQLPGFGTKALLLNTGARHSLSLKTVEDRSVDIAPGTCAFMPYAYERRYITVKDIAFDLLITLFDVNSSSIVALRCRSEMTGSDLKNISGFLSRIKHPNLELRAIGLQNSASEPLQSLQKVRKLRENVLAEADIFGGNIRHIAIDAKTGMTYNLLLQNRIYRPGELANENTPTPAPAGKPEPLRFILPGDTRAASHKQAHPR